MGSTATFVCVFMWSRASKTAIKLCISYIFLFVIKVGQTKLFFTAMVQLHFQHFYQGISGLIILLDVRRVRVPFAIILHFLACYAEHMRPSVDSLHNE